VSKAIIISDGASVDPAFLDHMIDKKGKQHVICCDGGVRHLRKLHRKPDVIIGDMDSIKPDQLNRYKTQGIKTIKYPARKDFTDTELALDYAIKLNPTEILICCALGGRIDHALANVFLLLKARQKGIKACLVDEYCEIFVLNNKFVFVNEAGKSLSLLALSSRVEGLSLSGFLYPLKMADLKMGESRGISNVIKNKRASICLKKGNLLVIKYRRKNFFPKAF